MTVIPTGRLYAPLSPPNPRSGWQYIDYSSISSQAKGAREKAGKFWPGGWPALRKAGWRIIRVQVAPERPHE